MCAEESVCLGVDDPGGQHVLEDSSESEGTPLRAAAVATAFAVS